MHLVPCCELEWDIAFCVESEIGKVILNNPILYESFVDKVELLLRTSLSQERFTAAIENTKDLLAYQFQKNSTALAMEKLQRHEGPLVGDAMMQEISAFADGLLNLYVERRELLLERIQIYRDSNLKH